MVESTSPLNKPTHQNKSSNLVDMCKIASQIINQLYSPIDASNRFLNLALQNLEEGSPSRQFLLDSKEGIRKTSLLLKKLNNYTNQIEKELHKLTGDKEAGDREGEQG